MPITELTMPMTEEDRGCLGPLPHLKIIYTIGYGDVTARELFAMLKHAGVTLLVDVRLFPHGAYTFYTALRDMPYICEVHDIDHVHIPALAPSEKLLKWYKPALGRDKHPPPQLWRQYKRRYVQELVERRVMFETHQSDQRTLLEEPDLSTAYNMLRGKHERIALMCVEQHPLECHRSLAADMISFLHTGLEVKHLVTAKVAKRQKIEDGGAYCVV
ncbi:DUF488 domain-containing protein [Candidatus Uhrbacteria bacterium]|jgi:hypothetical protein|nr:DUF488 domain-containing protein [Candidatus Uhrbacteria bacterium]MBT7716982.1 DUF488 domain-containing protein [Candidatus Uhrbacteria bacterium]